MVYLIMAFVIGVFGGFASVSQGSLFTQKRRRPYILTACFVLEIVLSVASWIALGLWWGILTIILAWPVAGHIGSYCFWVFKPGLRKLKESENVESLVEEGVCLAEKGKYQEALSILNRVLDMDPKNMGALTNKANLLNRLQKYKEALVICDIALAQSPEDIWALLYKGIALTNLSECLDAMRAFDRVLKITPDNQEAIKNKGRCHYKYYEGLGILKDMPDYTWKKVSLIDTEVLIEEAGRILARKHGAKGGYGDK